MHNVYFSPAIINTHHHHVVMVVTVILNLIGETTERPTTRCTKRFIHKLLHLLSKQTGLQMGNLFVVNLMAECAFVWKLQLDHL